MKRAIAVILVLSVVAVSGFTGGQSEAGEEDGGYRIALSNDYAGNSWRQQMIRDWEAAAEVAIEEGIVSEAPVFTTNESSAAEQASQMQNLILEGYDAIVLNSASPTALNGAVRSALDEGIVVVSFDNVVEEERAWRLITDFEYMGAAQVEFIADRFDSADILEVRGLPGSYVNDAIHEGIVGALEDYPDLEIVGEVYGEWTQSVAQREVAGILSSLDNVDAVVTQGGDGFGTVKAFENADREIPLVMMGNRYDEMQLWQEMKEESGYETLSISIAPGVATIAFWTAVEVLEGNDVPKEMRLPPLTVTSETLDYFLENTEEGGVATIRYPRDWVEELISNWKAGDPPPEDPLPAEATAN